MSSFEKISNNIVPHLLDPDSIRKLFEDLLSSSKFRNLFSNLNNIPETEGSEGKQGLMNKEGKSYFQYSPGMEVQLHDKSEMQEEKNNTIWRFLHYCELLSQAGLDATKLILSEQYHIDTNNHQTKADLLTHSILRITLYDTQTTGHDLIDPHTDRWLLTHILYGDDTGYTRIYDDSNNIVFQGNANSRETILFPGDKAAKLIPGIQATLHDAIAGSSPGKRLSIVYFISLPKSYFPKEYPEQDNVINREQHN